MPFIQSQISLSWNVKNRVSSTLGFSYHICNSNIHLARYVSDLFGNLDRLRSINLYNMYYRMIGKELCRVNQEQMKALFNLFLESSDLETLKSKWSKLIGFTFRSSFSENQYRSLLYAFRDSFFRDPTPKSIRLALQTALNINNNKIKILEFFKDSEQMGYFLFGWAVRDDATLIASSTTNGTVVQNAPNKLRDTVLLASAAVNQYAGFQIVITSGLGITQVRTVLSNDNTSFTLDTNWVAAPNTGDNYIISIIKTVRDDVSWVRRNVPFYYQFGLSNNGFQVWVSIDDYLNIAGFINDYVKAIKPVYTQHAIAYILHRTFSGSLIAALADPNKNPVYIAIGTGDPSWDPFDPQPTGTETALYAETKRVIALSNYIDANEDLSSIPTRFFESSGFFEPKAATSDRIMEVGLFSENGTLLAYQAFSAIKKKEDDAMIWKFRSTYDSL